MKTETPIGDTPEYRQGHHDGRSELIEDSEWRESATELLQHYLGWNPDAESLQMRLHKTVNQQRLLQAQKDSLRDAFSTLAKSLLSPLKEAYEWNEADINGFEEITPSMEMLEQRSIVLLEAIKKIEDSQ